MSDTNPLCAFFGTLDDALATEDGRARLMAMLGDGFAWEISLNDKVVEGDRAAFEAFLEARAAANATSGGRHRVEMAHRDGARAVVMGYFETGGDAPSPFISTAVIDDAGKLTHFMHRRSSMRI